VDCRSRHRGIPATFAYDTRDLLTSVTRPLPSGGSKTLGYGYDALGRRTSKTLEAVTTTYAFNNDETLQSVVVGAPFNYTSTYTYDAAHRLTRVDRANGAYTTYGYNNDDWLTLLEHRKTNNALLASFGYGYDAANKLLTAGNITFSHDLNGNVTQRTVNSVSTTYGYNFENELTSVTGSVSLTYSYNAFGERVSQSDGMTTTQFVYDAEEGDLQARVQRQRQPDRAVSAQRSRRRGARRRDHVVPP